MSKLVKLQFIEVYKHNPNLNNRIFNFHSQHIGEIFLENLREKKLGIMGIKIGLSNNYEEDFPPTSDYPVEGRLINFDFETFENNNDHLKKKMVLDIILKIITELAERYGWDIEQFNDAYKKILKEPLPPNPYDQYLDYE